MPYYSTNNKNQTYSYDAPVNPETPDSWKNSGDVSDTSSVQVINAEYIQPKTWYSGTQPTNGEALAQIARIYEYDQQKATNLYNQYNTLINNPTSSFYQPYLNPTNPAVKNLAQYGIDTSNINDDWFNQYSWLTQYYTYGDTTNTPNKPGKKATIQQKAAYEYYQLWKARDTTNAVNNEWSALQQELQYWAKRDDLNLSDQEIIDKIDWKKYSTLDKLRQRKNPGDIVEINNGTEFSADNMRGVIWAARNNGGERNMNLNTAYSFMGKGNTWQDNPDISEKLKRSSDKYNPNAVGMTLNEAGLYFGRSYFDQEWIDQNRWMLDSQDETQRKMYLSVVDSENTTKSAEDEAAAMNAYIDKLIRDKGGKLKADDLLKYLENEYNNGEYSTLQKMNKAIQNGGNPLGLTRAVDFKYAEVQEMLRQKATEEYNKVHALDIAMEYAAGKGTEFILNNDWGKTFNDAVNWLSDQAQAILDNRVRNVQQPEEGTAAPEQGTVAPAAPEATVEEPKTFTLKQDEGKTFDTDIGKEGVRNLRNGWKVQDAVKDGASVQSPLDAAQARIAQAKDEKAAAAAAACEPSMNATERNVAAGYSSMSIIASNAISDSVFNMVHKAGQAVVDQSGDDIISGYITNGLAVYPSIDRFERTQDNARNLKAREDELAAELGDKAYIGNDKKSRQTLVQIDGKTYRVTVRDEAPSTLVGNNFYGQDVDNVGYIESIEDISSGNEPHMLSTNLDAPDWEYLNNDSREWINVESSPEVQEFIKKRQAAQGMVRTEEEEAKAKELQQVRMDLEDAEDYLRQNKEAYEHDMEIANDAMRQMNNLESILLDAGGDLTEVYEGQIMIRALADFSDYEATQWTEYNPSSQYATRIQDGEDLNTVLQDAAAEYAEMKEQLADIQFIKQWCDDRGIKIPGSYMQNINRRIEKIGRDMKDYEFFVTQFNPDFQEKAREGEKILGDEWFNAYSKNPQMYGKWQLPGQIESAFNGVDDVLPENEKDIYRYLYALDKENGTHLASDYASFMCDRTYGVLNVRKAFDIQKSAEELTNINLFGFGVANALAVFASPLNAIANTWDAVDRLFTGRERNPYSQFRHGNIFKNTIREESAKAIENEANKLFGEGTTAAKVANTVAQGAYEIMTMRADSAMNAMTFGWIFGGGPGAEAAVEGGSKLMDFLTQVAQAAPMGISAASDAAAQAKIKGASDTQALLIAAGTFAAETITEGIEIGHITSAFRNAKEAGTDAIKDFLKEWLTDNGVSEMFGETLTEIFEKHMDQWVLDDNEHKALVNSYRLNLQVSKEEAEAMALRDEMGDYLRTAIISYLSPGMDILQTYGGKQQYYRSLARDINDNSITRVTARDVRKGEKAYRKEQKAKEQARIEAEQEAKRNGATEELPPINLGALEGQNQTEAEPAAQAEPSAPAAEPAAAQADTESDRTQLDTALGIAQQKAAAYHANAANIAKQKALEFLANNKVLTAAQSMERTGADAAVTSVLDIARTSESGDVARATTAGMHTLMEEAGMVDAPAALLQEALEGAQLAGIDPSLIRSGMTSAALGGEQSAARQVIMSNEYHQANAEGKAAMLAQAAAADVWNESVQQEIAKAVHDNRVAEAECALMAEGAGDAVIDLENQVRALAAETKAANQALETQQGVEAAANEAADRATQEMLANPGDVNTARAQEGAVNQQVHEAAVTDERQQAVENAQQREQEGQQKLDQTRNDTMTTVREQAEANVAQEDQQRADAEAQAQEEQRIQAEQEEQNRIQQEEDDNADLADREAFVDNWVATHPEATEEDRDELRRIWAEERQAMQAENAQAPAPATQNAESDEFGRLDDMSARKRAKTVKDIERRFGIKIQAVDTEATEGFYYEGKLENNVIYLDSKNVTVDDIMYRVLGHELTHVAEDSNTYSDLSRSIARISYGVDTNVDAAIANLKKNNGVPTNKLEADIVSRKAQYDKQFGRDHSYEYIAKEVIADRMGDILNNPDDAKRQDLINRLVDDDVSVARRVLNSIKSFLRKATGMKGAWYANAQKTVEMLETALNDVTEKTNPVNYRVQRSAYSENPVVRFDSRWTEDQEAALRKIGMVPYKNSYGWGWRVGRGVKLTENQIRDALNGGRGRYSLATEKTAKPAAIGDNGETLTESLPGDTQVKYSLNSWTNDEKARVQEDLIKKGFKRKDVDKWINDTNSIAAMIAADRTRLDFEASDNQVFLKKNNDYYFTLDASTLCAKRLLYQGTFDYVQHALPDEVFTPEDLIDLVNIMSDMGYETPCGICYVESRRRWLDTYASLFLDKITKNPDGLIEKYFKKSTDEEKAAIRESLTKDVKPSIDDLTTSDGLEKLRHDDPYMYKAFVADMNAKGSANPKVVQLRTEYRGDIGKLTASDIQKVKDIGGLRIQSFSDFETPHLLDMIQAVLDMSSVGLTSQAYTKVPNFAWVFGDTGIKINLSLIGKGTGLDENGNLVFDNVEGINFDEAMKLRNRYSKNVGTILVGINDDHIIAAMGDPRIDFIIPFHKSGWSDKELKGIRSLHYYKDYTDSQNERIILGRANKVLKEWKTKNDAALQKWIEENGENYIGYRVEETEKGYRVVFDGYKTESFDSHKKRTGEDLSNLEPVGANQYWNFKKSGQWNAENYLKMCAEQHRVPKFSQFLVDNGDGSFSLPQGTDKRSTSIREGYWKTLIDFKMYENDGYGRTAEDGTRTKVKGAEQKEVTPNINMSEAYRVMNEYQLGRQMPNQADGTPGKFIPMESNNSVPVATEAADQYIALIKQRRADNKPIRPDDTLEATPEIDVGGLKNAPFGRDQSNAPKMDAATAMGASEAPATLGNMQIETEQPSVAGQNAMAVDAETGETVHQRFSLPNVNKWFDDYIDTLSADELDELAQEMFGVSLKSPGESSRAAEQTMQEPEKEQFVENAREAYLQAVNDGDLGTAQGIIDKIAKQAGYTVRGTHRTNADFTVFDRSKQTGKNGKALGDGFYVAAGEHSEYDNDSYGKNRMLVYINPGNVFNIQENGITEKQAREVYEKYFAPYHPAASDAYDDDNPYTSHVIRQLQKSAKVMDYIKEAAENAGVTTDVIFKELGYDSIKDGPQYVVFDPEQIKSANPVTYDDQGEMIDPDNRFGRGNADIRYSLPSDAPYLSAVDHDDMEEAQRLVDEAAKKAGYTETVYHGTPTGGFTQFKDWSYFTKNKEYADRYQNASASSIRGRYDTTNPMTYQLKMNPGRVFDTRNPETAKVYQQAVNYYGLNGLLENGLPDWTDGRDLIEYIEENNLPYDTIILDEGGDGGYGENVTKRGLSYVTRSNRVKSAEPVTYDNNGNVIPLSERFKASNNDIRYSLPSDDVIRKQIRQYVANGGSLSTDTTQQTGTQLGFPGESAQRQFGHQSAQRSDALHEEVKDYLYNHSSYTPDSNQAQIDRAIDWVRSKANADDTDGYYTALDEVTADNFDYRSADGQARMLTVMSMAALKAQSGDRSALQDELRLADAFNRQGTDLGRQLQARKIFRLMTPLGRKSVLHGMVDQVNREYERTGNTTRVHLSNETLNEAGNAQTEEDFVRARKKAAREIAEQTSVSWKDKLTAWRMLSMLANPRTHVRNTVGNLMFMPAVGIKNKLAAVAELGVKKENRTKTLGLATQDARAFAKDDAKAIKDILTGEAKYKEKNPVRAEQKIWGTGEGFGSRTFGRALQWLSDINGKALEGEDWIFLNRHYRNALAGYMTARGLTSKDMKGKTLEDARIYAVQEAQKATYRDANKVIEGLNKFESSHPGVKFFGSAILPFKKTPANILKRGMEYSPAGLIKAFTLDAKHLKQYNDYTKGKLKALPEKAISPTQWIDKVCSGLTGSAITALGFLLASAGYIKCGFDDKDDEFDRLEGEQEYGLTMEIFGQDVSYTLDWAAPLCMPFFVGAAMVGDIDLRVQDEEGETDWYKTALNGVDAILHMGEPIFNLSMLDGVSSLLNVNQNGADTMAQVAMKVGVNYVTSFMPSIVGAAARSIDTTRRMNYKPSGMTDLERIVNSGIEQVQNKFPFLSRKNIPYRNAWGDEDVSDQAWAIIENVLSPGYGNTVERDPLTEEMRRLYDATKESAVVPKLPNKTFSDEKVQYSLDAQQYDQFTIDRNQQAKSILAELIQTPEYAMADDTTRAYMVKSVWDYTTDLAKARVSGRNAEAASNPVDMVIDKAIDKNKSDEKSGFNTALKEALVGSNLEDAQTAIAGLRRAGKADKDIKSTVTSTLKPLYQEAYLKDDGDTMYEIEELLMYLDDDMSWKTSDWLKNLDEAEEEEETERETRWLNRNNQ